MADSYCPNRDTVYPIDPSPECTTCEAACCESESACVGGLCTILNLVQIALFGFASIWTLHRIIYLLRARRPYKSAQMQVLYFLFIGFIWRTVGFIWRLLDPTWILNSNRGLYTLFAAGPTVALYLAMIAFLNAWCNIFKLFDAMHETRFFGLYKKSLTVAAGIVILTGLIATPLFFGIVDKRLMTLLTVVPRVYLTFPWLAYGVFRLSREVENTVMAISTENNEGTLRVLKEMSRIGKLCLSGFVVASFGTGLFFLGIDSGTLSGFLPCELTVLALRLTELAICIPLAWFLRKKGLFSK